MHCREEKRWKNPIERKRQSYTMKKRIAQGYIEKMREIAKKLWQDPDYRRKQMEIKQNPDYIERARKAAKKGWQDKKKVQKRIKSILKATAAKPNKAEQKLYRILQDIFPGQYLLNVEGYVIIGRSIPDFININGQKKIIELFGEHWHPKEDEEKRINLFRTFGYSTLIIWESELKDEEKLKEKLIAFHNKIGD